MSHDVFGFLYAPYQHEHEAFGSHWRGPETYPHFEDTLIATYPKDPENGDGQPVEVYGCAAPARFYTLRVLAATSSLGEWQPAYEVRTGSGQHALAAQIADAISTGMLTWHPSTPATAPEGRAE